MPETIRDSRKSHSFVPLHKVRFHVKGRTAAAFCITWLLILSAYSQNASQGTQQSAQPKQASGSPPAASDYVGSETCKTCHEDLFKHFERTAHFATVQDKKAAPDHQGCEACHGPGKAHVEGGGDVSKIISFKTISTEEASKRCLTCHTYNTEHANFLRSPHATNNVGCTSCHSPHHAKSERALLTEKTAGTLL